MDSERDNEKLKINNEIKTNIKIKKDETELFNSKVRKIHDQEMIKGSGGELHQVAKKGQSILTTQQGTPISDDQNTLRAGPKGPALLEDFVFRDKIFHFDHERIPERVVHARGFGAHGFFENYESLEALTSANLFQQQHQKTPAFVRFSTVAGNKGSMDLARDVRGFAVKLYTQEGNWDIVGNNIPVFFIQDPIKFPDLIHAAKDEPDRGFPQAQTAHDNFWDFISLTPESMHMVMWIMSDRAIPRSFRFMEGFGVHTFRMINQKGKETFVKFHWKPKLGLQSVLWDEAVKINGADPDFHRRDLWNAIQQGNFPEWELGIQCFDRKFAEDFPFDVLDATKLIPEEEIPVKIVGRLVLDRCVDNFFAETEQVAFCTQNIVPGIDFTDDPLLQGRNFSYLDTQLKRLGSPNFTHLPINAPKCPFAHFQQDGHMAFHNPKGRVNYNPNSWNLEPRESPDKGFRTFSQEVNGPKLRARDEKFADHYSQAKQFYQSQTIIEQKHIAEALIFELGKVEKIAIRERLLGHLLHIDEVLASKVAKKLGVSVPSIACEAAKKPLTLKSAPSLSILRKKTTLVGRKLGIIVEEGGDSVLFNSLIKAILQEKATYSVIAPTSNEITLNDGMKVKVNELFEGGPSVLFDALVLLVNGKNESILKHPKIHESLMDAFFHHKYIGFSSEAKVIIERHAFVEFDDGVKEINTPNSIKEFMDECRNLRYWSRKINDE